MDENYYCQRLAKLRTDRANWDNQWEEAAAVVYRMDYSGLSCATIVQKLRSLAKEAP